jgi:hypothetical protein
VLESIGEDWQCQRLCLRLGLLGGLAIDEDAGQIGYLSDPSAVALPF